MKNLFYNAHEFEKALNVMNDDPNIALARFEKYIEKFPLDYDARTYYISLIIKLKNLEEAELKLSQLEYEMAHDYQFQKHSEKNKKAWCSLMFCKVKLLFYQNKYQECYDLLENTKEAIIENNLHFETTHLFCRKKLGLLTPDNLPDNLGYLFSQIIDYSEERFLDHIKKHLITNDQTDEEKTSVFKEDFPFEKVYEEIKKHTLTNFKIYNGILEDLYIYKYDFCGTNYSKNTDYFKVVAIHDSDNFITMCPCIKGKNWECIDLNYLREDKPKQMSISQISKFNQRYNKILDK